MASTTRERIPALRCVGSSIWLCRGRFLAVWVFTPSCPLSFLRCLRRRCMTSCCSGRLSGIFGLTRGSERAGKTGRCNRCSTSACFAFLRL